MIVLDASVILKWVLDEEPQGSSARSYRNQHLAGNNQIAVPELLFYEIASGLVARTSLTPEEAIEGFTRIVETELESHNLRVEDFATAIQMSRQFNISLYDSSYIALAAALGCEFITADAHLAKKVKSLPYVKLLR